MDNIKEEGKNIIENGILSRFVKCLPDRHRKKLREELQKRIPGHSRAQFYNWTSEPPKTSVPEYLFPEINEACRLVFKDHIEELVCGVSSDDYLLNIFSKNMQEDNYTTTIRKEMAEMDIRTQKELAEKTKLSEQTISRVLNDDVVSVSWDTVYAISEFFGKAPKEFREFAQRAKK